MTNLTRAQRDALEKYADGNFHNERQLRIHATTYDSLVKKGLIKRVYFLQSAITQAGKDALNATTSP